MSGGATLAGRSLLGYGASAPSGRTFRGVDPARAEPLAPDVHAADPADVERAAELAAAAFPAYAATGGGERAAFLRGIALELEARADALVERAGRETALPEGRLRGELGRTTHQLRMFADIAEAGRWVDARIDPGDPDRTPAPRPDVRSLRVPLGPVAVFGASNFPLAFSVAGGDTASALAAGCPVVVKAHPAHPGTSELAGAAIVAAARAAAMPEGVFSLLFDDGYAVGEALVGHPAIAAVGFTGSRRGGLALMRRASERPVPIPVYAEMSSVNPIFVLPAAAGARAAALADGLHASVTLGTGQFCTNPGLVFVPAGPAGDALRARLAELVAGTGAGTMLTEGICRGYGEGLARLEGGGARLLARGAQPAGPNAGRAALWEADLGSATDAPAMLEEVFGPSTLLLRYRAVEELQAFARRMEGQLSATVHGEDAELDAAPVRELVTVLAHRVGRVIFNQYPTGVEVTDAMVHGGPFPATSDGRSTSVGGRALLRFTRLVAFQNAPSGLLPAALR